MRKRGKTYLYIATLVCMILLCLILVACKPVDNADLPTPPNQNDTSQKPETPKPDTPTTVDKLTIYYNDMGKTTAIEYVNEDIITLYVPKTRTGYDFLYWLAEDGSPITSTSIYNNSSVDSIYLTAAWKAIDYTITLKYNDGSGRITDRQYNIDSETFNLDKPTRQGYDFLGWYNGNYPAPIAAIKYGTTGDFMLTAKWKTQTYSITYSNVDLGFTAQEEYNITTNDFTLPIPTRERCEFLGWYKYNNLSGEMIVSVPKGSSGNLEVFAKWSAPIYNISYELFGGKGAGLIFSYSRDTQTVNLEKITPTKDGFKFLGWYQHPDCADNSLIKTIPYTNTVDYKLFAAWTSNNATANIEYSQLECSASNKSSIKLEDHADCHYTVKRTAPGLGNVYNIANTYKSRPVKKIDRLAFQSLKNVTINIPNSITTISEEVFRECSENTIINLPTTLKTIGNRCFYKASSLSAIIPASVGGNLGEECFAFTKNCNFSISEGVTAIPNQAFYSASVSRIMLPNSIEKLGDFAFAGITSTSSNNGAWIRLGGKITFWGGGLFTNSKISRLDIDRSQTTISTNSLFDLYNMDTDYFTPISMNLTLINYIATDIYSRIMGFNNPNFRVKLDCSTVNNNMSLLGHYSSNEFTHSLEEVCISRVNDDKPDGIKNNYIIDLKAINTIAHETRHYFQNLCFKKKIKTISSSRIPYDKMPGDIEIKTWNPDFYISASDAPEKYPEYYHQPVEEDARRTATEITGYLPKHTPCIKCPSYKSKCSLLTIY